jgi:hypothetical protein
MNEKPFPYDEFMERERLPIHRTIMDVDAPP